MFFHSAIVKLKKGIVNYPVCEFPYFDNYQNREGTEHDI